METRGDPSRASEHRPPESDVKWTPRVEGEEGDPTRFDFVFGGVVAVVVIGAILWALGVISF